MELMHASHQWATRPNDQRFLTLEELHAHVSQRKSESWTASPPVKSLQMLPNPDKGLVVRAYDMARGQDTELTPTNWAFSQLCGYAKSPAAYMRQLPDELVAINLQWMIDHNPQREDALILAHSNGDQVLRAMTSLSYGRIWDQQVVELAQRINVNGNWKVPAASYSDRDPRRATTLYASDRDVFMFMVDPDHPIDIPGHSKPMFRGWMMWNSEVGSAVWGTMTFLYDFICDNRIIWGASNVKELTIRHTGGAPERFAYEGAGYLERYANEGTAEIVDAIVKAEHTDIPLKKEQTVEQWLRERGFTKAQAAASTNQVAQDTGSNPRSLWDIISGVTAYARSIPHTDERVQVERQAGDLMKFAQ